MNMFELHDFLHGNIQPGGQTEIPMNQNIDFGKFPSNTVQVDPTSPITQQGKPFPWDMIKIAGGLILLGYALHKIFPKHDNCPSYFERRRLAKKQTSKQN